MHVPQPPGTADYLRDDRTHGIARLIVVGQNPLKPEQRAEAMAWYARFRLERSTALGNYFVRNITLVDGSFLRMVSNHGEDFVSITPAGGEQAKVKGIELQGYVFLPSDKNNTSGWNKGLHADSARAYLAAGTKASPTPKPELHVKLNAGTVDWHGTKGVTLTWDHGGNNRYDTQMWNTVFTGTNTDNSQLGIYYKGTKISTPVGVSAAAVYQGFLVMIGKTGDVYYCPSPINSIDHELSQGRFRATASPVWSTVTVTGSVASARRASAWHFKPDGSVAASAWVDSSFGVDTWNLTRMRTEALTMMKRYLTFSVVGGVPQAALTDVSFSCDPIAVYVAGSGTPQSGAISGSGGSLSFGGKRLWAVDFDSSGNELVVTYERGGSGQYDWPAASSTTHIGWNNYWCVKVNGTELFRADYVMPTIDFTWNGATSGTAVASATSINGKSEYLAVHAMDARYMAAIIERLTYTQSAASITGISATAGVTADCTQSAQIEVIFAGSVLATHSETLDTSLTPARRMYTRWLDPRFGVMWYRTDTGLPVDEQIANFFPSHNGMSTGVNYPQLGDSYTENEYEEWFRTHNSGSAVRDNHFVFQSYPNQVADVLAKSFFAYNSSDPTQVYYFGVVWGSADAVFLGSYTGSVNSTGQRNYFHLLGVRTKLPNALAIPRTPTLHFIASTCDFFVNQYYDTIKKMANDNQGMTITGEDPTFFASLFTRQLSTDAFADNDLLVPTRTKLTDEGNTVNNATFHIDPVRLL